MLRELRLDVGPNLRDLATKRFDVLTEAQRLGAVSGRVVLANRVFCCLDERPRELLPYEVVTVVAEFSEPRPAGAPPRSAAARP